jgi:hypothetical protein
MAPKAGLRSLVLATSATLLLAGCGTWWQLQQQTLQRRLAAERCRQQRASIDAVLAQAKADQRALDSITAEVYKPTPTPAPPDPELASRFSELDRQLDNERYDQQLAAWREREVQRQARWGETKRERSGRASNQLRQHVKALGAIDSNLVRNGRPNPVAIAKARRCPTA